MVKVDLVVVGSGFGGSVMAMVAYQLGLSVALLEQGKHPRMAIGESTTPLSNLLLEKLANDYALPRLAPLAKWGVWQRAYPQISCGLKRGFTFFHESGRLLVAASPRDEIADTHWYRQEVDLFLALEAQCLGVTYLDGAHIENVQLTGKNATMTVLRGDRRFHITAGLVIDATGPRGFLHRTLHLAECALPGMPRTEGLYSHFTQVGRTDGSEDTLPYHVDDAAVHHVFDGGWVWVLRFNNGVTSAGIAATPALAAALQLSQGEPAWRRLMEHLPRLRAQFAQATACQPFRHVPALSFHSSAIVGQRWAMLPSAAGFVDPLLSTGFTLTLKGIERLAQILASGDFSTALQNYAQCTQDELLDTGRLIGALYATMSNFTAFTAVSMLYFAAVSFSETAFRLGKPEMAPGFVLPAARGLLEQAHRLHGTNETEAFVNDVRRAIEPFNLGRFGDPGLGNCYPVRAEDLLEASTKLGATKQAIAAMLQSSGFSQ